ncbi:hypothetical protein SFC88_11305 [Nocardioides sp. HM23]|uniref:hypothetical protein n=1 Tax=Nocardioides bizhenqiangii TaxID=3095076 RepID=UPI002ACA2BA2|nr:hypothetical protein [Nocardioides sp. HM23]MDZ5621420.1 hypothetical protein [Nocardioides sp. HM23]
MSTRRVMGALAVVGVLVVVGGGCGGDDRDGAPSPDATSADASASTAPAGPIGWVDALPIGPPPTIGYVIGHTYHSPDGRTVELPRDRGITAIARLGDGFLVVDDRYFEGTAGVELLDARGNRVREIGTVAGTPVLSPDGSTLRWITFTPSEVSRSEWRPTRLHTADVATGEIRSRVIHRDRDELPEIPQPEGLAEVSVRRGVVLVVDHVTGEQVARLPSPGSWIRGRIRSAAWEDRAHLLVSYVRGNGRAATILRVDVRTGDWSLAVDWTPTQRSSTVAFETGPAD